MNIAARESLSAARGMVGNSISRPANHTARRTRSRRDLTPSKRLTVQSWSRDRTWLKRCRCASKKITLLSTCSCHVKGGTVRKGGDMTFVHSLFAGAAAAVLLSSVAFAQVPEGYPAD